MHIRGLGRQCECPIRQATTPHSWKWLPHDECYHVRRARRESPGGLEIAPSLPDRGQSEAVGADSSLFLRAPLGAIRVARLLNDETTPAVATDCPAPERHGRILNCIDERRENTPRSPRPGGDRERAWPQMDWGQARFCLLTMSCSY